MEKLDTGVETIEAHSVTFDNALWCVTALSGVTPAGEPVRLDKRVISASVGTVPDGHNLCDLFVSAKPVGLIVESAARTTPSQPRDHALYLGRWWKDRSTCRLVRRPLPRCLRAVEDLPAEERFSWQEWTRPLVGRLDLILERSRNVRPPTIDAVLAASKAAELLMHGADLLLSALATELRALDFHCQLMLDGTGASAGRKFARASGWSPGSVVADDLPKELAALCDPFAPKPVPKHLTPEIDYAVSLEGGVWTLRFAGPIRASLEIRLEAGRRPVAPSILFERGRSLKGCQGLSFEFYEETRQYIAHVPQKVAAVAGPTLGWGLHNLADGFDPRPVLSISVP